MKRYIDINPEVKRALQNREPVVALESTIISHGMPFPFNVETALAVEDAIRQKGAVAATIGIISGRIKVGLSEEEIYHLARAEGVIKVSRRDFPYVIAKKMDGATTVAATMIIAEEAGIRIFVTGGMGGVHRGASESFDISADLEELKRTGVVVVCAGIKSILDIGATLEYLETSGVPVITYGADYFPAFYSRSSGFPADYRSDDIEEIAEIIKTKYQLGLKGGMVIGCPVPEPFEIPLEMIESKILTALKSIDERQIKGKRITPFMLDQIKDLTEGKSLKTNKRLILNNAEIGGEIAIKLANLSV